MSHCNQYQVEFCTTGVSSPSQAGLLSILKAVCRSVAAMVSRHFINRRRRRNFLKLHRLDDKMLADIGVTRDEVNAVSDLSLSINAAAELHRISLQRRRRENAGELPR